MTARVKARLLVLALVFVVQGSGFRLGQFCVAPEFRLVHCGAMRRPCTWRWRWRQQRWTRGDAGCGSECLHPRGGETIPHHPPRARPLSHTHPRPPPSLQPLRAWTCLVLVARGEVSRVHHDDHELCTARTQHLRRAHSMYKCTQHAWFGI